MFKDRRDAGRQLAQRLVAYRGQDAVVVALPRGGVVLGHEVAHALALPLDIIITRKIGHPLSPEYAIGAVDEHGTNILNTEETISLDRSWLKSEIAAQKIEARRRSILYRKARPAHDFAGKIVIVVDDGIATGYTMRLAIKVIKQQRPRKVVVAVPVASHEAIISLAGEVDEVITIEYPETFMGSIGAYYHEFEQVSDAEVARLLG
jgi:predicted phosphoribosyltransferase